VSIALGLDKQVGTISIHSEQPRYDVHIGVGLAFIDGIVAHGGSKMAAGENGAESILCNWMTWILP